AIIVGAGSSNTQHSILSFSTYGNRVDIQGWGTNVLAAGYGNYATYDGDYNRTYAYFSGTSSATPVVTSAFALVQSFYYSKTGRYLRSPEILELLQETGYPQGGDLSKNIGPLPNVKSAIERLETRLGIKEDAIKALSIKASPNPAQDFIYLRGGSHKEEISFEIINILGQVVLKDKMINQNGYNISNLPKGNYIIKATDGKRIAVEKLIKK